MQKLKDRWGISSNKQLTIIFIVFAITGSCAAKLAAPATALIGLTTENTPLLLYWVVRIALVFPPPGRGATSATTPWCVLPYVLS